MKNHLNKPWCREFLKVGREGGDRGWDGWMASLTQWKWVWANFGCWWCTGNPGVLLSMGSQWVRHDWVKEPNWTDLHVPLISDHLTCISKFGPYFSHVSENNCPKVTEISFLWSDFSTQKTQQPISISPNSVVTVYFHLVNYALPLSASSHWICVWKS